MTRLSPQRRDLITVALLVIILLSTLPLLGSLFSERVPPPPTSTPTPTVEPTSTVESYIAPIQPGRQTSAVINFPGGARVDAQFRGHTLK